MEKTSALTQKPPCVSISKENENYDIETFHGTLKNIKDMMQGLLDLMQNCIDQKKENSEAVKLDKNILEIINSITEKFKSIKNMTVNINNWANNIEQEMEIKRHMHDLNNMIMPLFMASQIKQMLIKHIGAINGIPEMIQKLIIDCCNDPKKKEILKKKINKPEKVTIEDFKYKVGNMDALSLEYRMQKINQDRNSKVEVIIDTIGKNKNVIYSHTVLYNALLNMVKNAAEAGANKVDIKITIKRGKIKEFKITDNGEGMTPERIWEIYTAITEGKKKISEDENKEKSNGYGLSNAVEEISIMGLPILQIDTCKFDHGTELKNGTSIIFTAK